MRVSICIPTHNPKPEHVKEALESVLKQTFTLWELIIHDDASDMDIRAMIASYLHDPRVTFHKSNKHLGIGGNWNACMQRASGEAVAFLFQDDVWEPSYLEKSVNVLKENRDVGFTAANHSYLIESQTKAAATGIYEEVNDIRERIREGRLPREQFLREWIERGLRPNIIGEPSFVVLQHELVNAVGPFRTDMKQGLDADYWVRCLLRADGYWIAENLGTFRVHDSGATAKNEEAGTGKMNRARMFRSLIKELPAGEMKDLAKKTFRRELVGMIKKFIKRR